MGNHACECQTANERRARRQFVSICRARARVELLIMGLEGKTLYFGLGREIARISRYNRLRWGFRP
eukprot:2164175-Pleurochrysis_carterae.AAC.1